MNSMKTTAIVALTAAFTLGACSTPSEDDPYRQTKTGAVIGGLVGAVAGAISNDDDQKKGAIRGAIIGAGAGGAIGSLLDKQERDLRAQMSQDVVIRNTGDRLIVALPNDLLFDTDSAALKPVMRADLQALAVNLQKYPNSVVQVIGHTDNVGDAAYNETLSLRRANSVSSVLLANGVAANRVLTNGRGESQPIASNLTAEGRQQNRRVEIVILPEA